MLILIISYAFLDEYPSGEAEHDYSEEYYSNENADSREYSDSEEYNNPLTGINNSSTNLNVNNRGYFTKHYLTYWRRETCLQSRVHQT